MKLALLLLVPLLGCAVEEEDLPLTEEEGNVVLSQAAWWSTYTNDAHQIVCPYPTLCFVGATTWTIRKQRTVAEWCHESLGCGGVTVRSAQELLIAQQPDVGNFGLLVRHEIGHALRLHHTPTGIMRFPFHDPAATGDVLDECGRVGAC